MKVKFIMMGMSMLSNDCNMSAGVEVELKLAIVVRVMLRRNLDTTQRLLNGVLGTACRCNHQGMAWITSRKLTCLLPRTLLRACHNHFRSSYYYKLGHRKKLETPEIVSLG